MSEHHGKREDTNSLSRGNKGHIPKIKMALEIPNSNTEK